MTVDLDEYFAAHSKAVAGALESLKPHALAAGNAIVRSLESGGKIICFGNGGSSSQASHMAGELTGRFSAHRRSLPAISLTADAGTVSCISNDFGYEEVFSRQLEAFVRENDLALALTTSGKSANVLRGLETAKRHGAVTVALTGANGLAAGGADHVLAVNSSITAHIQELHLMLLHYWCMMIDSAFTER
jgi:D-sedoheptulose 7-phosphate isomerase